MKVDGGRSLTSRGQTDWYGWKYMTRKFEQEETSSLINYKLYAEAKKARPNDPNAIDDWCEDVQTSTWAIKDEQAHLKVNGTYANQDEDLEYQNEMSGMH